MLRTEIALLAVLSSATAGEASNLPLAFQIRMVQSSDVEAI